MSAQSRILRLKHYRVQVPLGTPVRIKSCLPGKSYYCFGQVSILVGEPSRCDVSGGRTRKQHLTRLEVHLVLQGLEQEQQSVLFQDERKNPLWISCVWELWDHVVLFEFRSQAQSCMTPAGSLISLSGLSRTTAMPQVTVGCACTSSGLSFPIMQDAFKSMWVAKHKKL